MQQLLSGSEVRYNAELPGSPEAVVRTVRQAGLEGVIAKRRDSIYRASTRSNTWLKLKLEKSQEFVIGGYNPDSGSFQSILVGYYERDKLMFAGKVRQGFNPALRSTLLNKLKPLLTSRCPFYNLPTSKKSHFGEGITADDMNKLRWLKPKLVAQVRFTEWTSYGLLRAVLTGERLLQSERTLALTEAPPRDPLSALDRSRQRGQRHRRYSKDHCPPRC